MEYYSLQFVNGRDVLDRPYLSLSSQLGENWQKLCRSPSFVSLIHEELSRHLCENFYGMDGFVIELNDKLELFADHRYWGRLEVTRSGMELYDTTEELLETIYCADRTSENLAW